MTRTKKATPGVVVAGAQIARQATLTPPPAAKDAEQVKNRADIFSALLAKLERMDECELGNIYAFAQIIELDGGNGSTPMENWIAELPSVHIDGLGRGRGLTPGDVIESLEMPRYWFDHAVKVARQFSAGYRHVLESENKGVA